jgi:phage shock protein A
MQIYSFGQCARLLKVDPKVFRRWVKEDLGLQEEDQVSRADGRVRYLTREQLERLADLHERTLPTDDRQEDQESFSAGSGRYKLLEDRLEDIEEALRASEQAATEFQQALQQAQDHLAQMGQRVGAVEGLAQWIPLLEGLSSWMSQVNSGLEQLTEAREQPDQLAELEAQHRQQMAELEERYKRQIETLEAQLAQYQKGRATLAAQPSVAKKQGKAKNLPKTLTSRSAFAALHHVPDSVVARACNSGKIVASNGKWLSKSRIIFQALGDRGKSDFYQIFHTRPDFVPCKQCPHEITQG